MAVESDPLKLLVEDVGDVRVLRINNPSIRNALDDETRGDLVRELDHAMRSSARAVVLTGGSGTFCSGGELRSMPSGDSAAAHARMAEMHRIIRTLLLMPKPVIAAVEGHAIGSGLSLVAACDYVIAAENAMLGATFGRVGLVADCGLLWTLPRRVGMGSTKRLCLFGTVVSGLEAHDIGLVDNVVPAGQVLSLALQTGALLAEGPPLAMAATKRLLTDAAELDAFLLKELKEQSVLLSSKDFREARAAFFSRRAPLFRGE